jgi:hypothetical protein
MPPSSWTCQHSSAAGPAPLLRSRPQVRRRHTAAPRHHRSGASLQHLESTRGEPRGDQRIRKPRCMGGGRRSRDGDSSSDSPRAAGRTEGVGCCCVRPGTGRPSWQPPRGGVEGQAAACKGQAAARPRGSRACAVPLRARRAAAVECKLMPSEGGARAIGREPPEEGAA